jgi:tetratricopeptide (TPR) repeat protein
MLRSVPRIASGHWPEVASELTSDIAYDEAVGEEFRQMTRRYWLGMMQALMDAPGWAMPQAQVLTRLEASPAWLQSLREGALLSLEIRQPDLARQALEPLRQIAERWPSTHSRGSLRLLEGLLEADDDPHSAYTKLAEARGLWPDPITLFSLGRFFAGQKKFEDAVNTLEALEETRGRTYRLFFPGLVSLGRLERARSLSAMSRFDEASRLYQRVMEDWGGRTATFRIGRQIRAEYVNLIHEQAKRR